jgi:hypothetical protein
VHSTQPPALGLHSNPAEQRSFDGSFWQVPDTQRSTVQS